MKADSEYDDIKVAEELFRNPSSLISNTWSKDPTKLAVVQAVASCLTRLAGNKYFAMDIVFALAPKMVCFLHSIHWKWRKCIAKLLLIASVPPRCPCPDTLVLGAER